MAIPSSLTQSASAIVDKSLASGARGSNTTVTDYTPLSNAFMRKAELDANIAQMYMDSTNQRAGMMADLEINKANLMLKGEELKLNAMMYEDQVRREEEANTLSPFEQITGVLAGAASGAAAGKTFGPKGALIGGVIGGVSALGAGKDRRAQTTVLGNIGMISTAAIQFKELGDKAKAKEQNKSFSDGLESLVNARNALAKNGEGPGTPAYDNATMEIENHIAGLDKMMIDQDVPIQERAETMGAYKKHYLGYDPDDESFKYAQEMKDITFEARNNKILLDPTHENHVAERDALYAKYNRAHMKHHGESLDKASFNSYFEDVQPGTNLVKRSYDRGTGGGSSSDISTGYNSSSNPGVTSVNNAGRQQPNASTEASAYQANRSSPGTNVQQPGVVYDKKPAVEADPSVPTEAQILDQSQKTADTLNKQKRQKVGMSESGASGSWGDDPTEVDDTATEAPAKITPEEGETKKEFELRKSAIKDEVKVNKKLQSQDEQGMLNQEGKNLLAGIDVQLEKFKTPGRAKGKAGILKRFGKEVSQQGIGGNVQGFSLPKVGKNASWSDDPQEKTDWAEIDQISAANTSKFTKMFGDSGNLSESDKAAFEALKPDPALSKAENIQRLVDQKELISRLADTYLGSKQHVELESAKQELVNKKIETKAKTIGIDNTLQTMDKRQLDINNSVDEVYEFGME